MKKININLLPSSEEQIKRKKIEFVLFASKVFFLIFLSIALLSHFISYQIRKMESYRNQLAAQLTPILPVIKKLARLKKQSDQLNSVVERLHTNRRHIKKILLILAELKLSAPLGVQIKTVEYNSEYLVIAGLLPSIDAYLQLMKKLKESDHLDFKLNYSLKENLKIEFMLKATL
ncbi:MAG: hypothetical protein V4471_02100 [Pseudomonadota bacterium]